MSLNFAIDAKFPLQTTSPTTTNDEYALYAKADGFYVKNGTNEDKLKTDYIYTTIGFTNDCDYICDGVADDVQIQAALNQNNVHIIFKSGNYDLAEQLVFTNKYQILEGVGDVKLISSKAKTGFAEFDPLGIDSGVTILLQNTAENIKFKNIYFDFGGNLKSDINYHYGVKSNQAKDIWFNDCQFTNSKSDNFWCAGIDVSPSDIRYSKNIHLDGNKFLSSQRCNVLFSGVDGGYVTNNEFVDCDLDSFDVEHNVSKNIYVSGNTFRSFGDTAMKVSTPLYQVGDINGASNIIFDGNNIIAGRTALQAIKIESNTGSEINGVVVSNNNIVGNSNIQVGIKNTGVASKNISIINNKIDGCTQKNIFSSVDYTKITGNIGQTSPVGIETNNNFLDISNNTMIDCAIGIYPYAAQKSNIIGNTLKHTLGTGTEGIKRNAGEDYNIIANNIIDGYTNNITVAGGANDSLFNNSGFKNVVQNNTGFGTATATNKITVAGGIDFSGSSFSGSGTGIWQYATNAIGFVNAGVTNVRINSSGYLGVGIVPTRPLHISSTGWNKHIIVENDNEAGIAINHTGATAGNKSFGFLVNNGTMKIVKMADDNTFAGGQGSMAFTGTNVGINNGSPQSALHLSPSSSAIIIQNTTLNNTFTRPAVGTSTLPYEINSKFSNLTNDYGYLRLSAGGGTLATTKSYIDISGYFDDVNTKNSVTIGTAGTEKLRVTETGNVGIGTTTPTSKLQVVGLPTYADNTAALAGGLTVGAFYKTATGVLMVVY